MAGKKGKSGRKPRLQVAATATMSLNAVVGDYVPPAWLGEIGRAKFDEMVAAVRTAGHVLLTACDLDAVAAYAEAWEDFHDAQSSIAANGAEIWGVDQYGNKICKQNPAVRRKNQAATRIRHGMARFGLSPGDRTGLREKPVDRKQDAFGVFVGTGTG